MTGAQLSTRNAVEAVVAPALMAAERLPCYRPLSNMATLIQLSSMPATIVASDWEIHNLLDGEDET